MAWPPRTSTTQGPCGSSANSSTPSRRQPSCSTRWTAYIDFLEDVTRSAAKRVNIFLPSRLDRDIVERFESGPGVAITATDNGDDIALFVKAGIAGRPQWSRRLSEQLRAKMVETLCYKSDGI